MPVTRDSEQYERKQVIFTKSLFRRFEDYRKKICPSLNMSEMFRHMIDKFLREKGY